MAPVSAAGAAPQPPLADAVAARYGVRRIDHATLAAWRGEADRTTHLLDVRTPEEFAAGHLPGSDLGAGRAARAGDRPLGRDPRRPARAGRRPGHARDHDRALADAAGLGRRRARPGVRRRSARNRGRQRRRPISPAVSPIDPTAAARRWPMGAAAVVLGPSAAYRQAHPADAVWSIRPRLDRLPAIGAEGRAHRRLCRGPAMSARLAAAELAELTGGAGRAGHGRRCRRGGTAGLPVVATPDDPPDTSGSISSSGTTTATTAMPGRDARLSAMGARPAGRGRPRRARGFRVAS